MNLRLARKYLDFAATEMDKKGYKDLADKIDKHVERLATADKELVELIVGDLKKIARTADLRDHKDEHEETDERPSRLAALRRRLALRRRVSGGDKRSALSERRLASLRSRRQARMEEYGDDESPRSGLSARLRKARLARRLRARRERNLD